MYTIKLKDKINDQMIIRKYSIKITYHMDHNLEIQISLNIIVRCVL